MYALLQHRPDMSYSRPLHQLAAFILVVMGTKNEQQAFWTLLGTIQNKLFPEVKGEVRTQQSIRWLSGAAWLVHCASALLCFGSS